MLRGGSRTTIVTFRPGGEGGAESDGVGIGGVFTFVAGRADASEIRG